MPVPPPSSALSSEPSGDRLTHALLHSVRDVLAVLSPTGILRHVGTAAEPVLGYAPERLIGTALVGHAHPDDRAGLQRWTDAGPAAPGRSEKPADIAFRFRHAGGGWRWVEVTGDDRRADPDIGGLVLTIRDVTGSFETAERLRASEARYQTLAESAPVGIFQTDASGGITFANARFAMIAGLPPERVLGDGWLAAVHSEDRAQVEADWRRGLAEGRSLVLDIRFHDPRAAADTPVLCQRVRLTDGSGFIGTVTDVSEYVRTASALLTAEARTKAILDTAADAILTIDDAGIVHSFNRAAEAMFGVSAADLLWHPLDPLIPVDHLREEDGRRIDFALGQTTAVIARSRAIEVRRGDGSGFPVELSVGASEADGRRLYTGILRDVTERRRIEHALIAAKEAAEAADQAKSAFVATMSHELRTPLNAVIGFAQLMEMRLGDPAALGRCAGYATVIRQSGEQLMTIVDDILDMARIEAGGLDLVEQPLDLAALMLQSAAQMEVQAARIPVQLETRIPGDLPPVRGDERRLRQALGNLLSNAVKFSHPGGAVALSAGFGADGWLAIVVRDHGIGLDPADIPRAMAPFQQVDQSMTRRYEGLGLGLPLALRLVEAHGGTLTIDSRPGEGCIATVRLPATRIVTPEEMLPRAG